MSDDHRATAETWLSATIAEHGHAIRHVFPRDEDGRMDFTYTIGLTAAGHPELVIEGMPQDVAADFLNDLAARVHAGTVLDGGTVLTDVVEDPAPFPLIDVIDTEGLTAVEETYGPVRALQVVIPDSTSQLPWDPGYRNPPDQQRLRGRLTSAHLSASPPAVTAQTAAQDQEWEVPQLSQDDVVLVCTGVLSGAQVTSIWHHASGPWTFTADDHTALVPTGPLVGISSALIEQLDHTVSGLAGLPAGARATRSGPAEWMQWPLGTA